MRRWVGAIARVAIGCAVGSAVFDISLPYRWRRVHKLNDHGPEMFVAAVVAALLAALVGVPLLAALGRLLVRAVRATSQPREVAWSERGIGTGFLVGAVRGAIAGAVTLGGVRLMAWLPTVTACVAFFGPPLGALVVEWRQSRTIARYFVRRLAQGWAILGVFLGFVTLLALLELEGAKAEGWLVALGAATLGSASLTGFESARARAATERTQLLLAACSGPGALTVLGVALVSFVCIDRRLSPLFGAFTVWREASPRGVTAVALATVGVSAAALAAGRPHAGASLDARLRRGLRFAAANGVGLAAASIVATETLSILLVPLSLAGALATAVVLALHALGMLVGRPVSARVSRWLEPGHAWLDRRHRALAHEGHATLAEAARAKGDEARAIDEARAALLLALSDPWLAPERREDTRRLAELLLAGERRDEIAKLPREVLERPVLEAEALRLAREPDAAVALLRGVQTRGEAGPRIRAGVHAALALAEADLGHFALAEAELAGLRVASAVQGPLLEAHGVARVAGYIEFKRRGV